MSPWLGIVVAVAALMLALPLALAVWARRNEHTLSNLPGDLKALAGDLIRLPGRLRSLAADVRTPRRARWWLIGLAT